MEKEDGIKKKGEIEIAPASFGPTLIGQIT